MKVNKDIAVIITKDNKAYLNFDKRVGNIMLEKISEILDIINDDVSRDVPRISAQSEGDGVIQIRR